MAAAGAMADNELAVAERALKTYLKTYPTDVAAIRMLAELAARLGRTPEAEQLLSRCLELSPGFHFARQNYAHILNLNNRSEKVLQQADILLTADPDNLGYLNLKAVALRKPATTPMRLRCTNVCLSPTLAIQKSGTVSGTP